jgi:hypothetical protein
MLGPIDIRVFGGVMPRSHEYCRGSLFDHRLLSTNLMARRSTCLQGLGKAIVEDVATGNTSDGRDAEEDEEPEFVFKKTACDAGLVGFRLLKRDSRARSP